MIRTPKSLLMAGAMAVALNSASAVAAPDVVVSIRPLHGLVSAVMDGVGEPVLLLDGAESPHSYALTPSDASALANADMVLWVGEPLETFLERPLAALSSEATIVTLAESSDIHFRGNREGGVWGAHDHGDEHTHDDDHEDHGHEEHTHDDHDDHDHAQHDHAQHDHAGHDHDHENHAHDDHEEHAHDDHEAHEHAVHDHGADDGHIWLDPRNAAGIVSITRDSLSQLDPSNASVYQANADATLKRLDQLEIDIRAQLSPVAGQPFLTSHDALQYFDRYFGLNAAGSITVSPDRAPSARRLAEIEQRVTELGAVCLLSEPEYQPSVMNVIQDAAQTQVGQVDPLGLLVEPGKDLYFDLMANLSINLVQCLGDGDS